MEYNGGGSGVAGRENRHSRMGIASFVLALLATVALVIAFVIIGSAAASVLQGVDTQNPQSIDPNSFDPNDPAVIALSLASFGLLGCGLAYLVSLGLGIAGIVQRRRKRLFAIIGAVLSGLVVLGFVLLLVLGRAASGI